MGVGRVYLDIVLVVIICHIMCVSGQTATDTSISYVGATVTINCPLTGIYTYPVWRGPPDGTKYNSGSTMSPFAPNHISWADNQRDLILTGVTMADAATYTCTVIETAEVGHHILHFRVLPGLPVISNTEPIRGVLSVRSTEAEELILTCECLGGFPAPTLAWYKSSDTSTPVASTPGTDGTSVTVTYTFTPDKNNDKDAYICQSSFTDSRPEPINQTSVQLYLNLKPSTPTVQQDGDATAGSNARMQCDTSGFRPEATIDISWKYQGTVHSGMLQTGPDNDTYRATSTLVLPVQRGDNGGSVTCTVTHSTLPSLSPLSRSTSMTVYFAPVSATVSGNTQTVADGTTTLTLKCIIGDANPAPAVSGFSWTGPGVGGKTSQTVTLTPTRDQDGAALACTAKNYVGSTTSQHVNLNLTYHPITNITEGTSITKTEGDTGLVLHCSTNSKPVSTITWSPNNNNQVIPGTNINHLNVGTVDRTDAGTYTCSADNGITGADREKSVTVNVLFPPLTVGLTGNNLEMVADGANKLTLICTADYSRPVSTITWRYGSSHIFTDITRIALSGSLYGGTQYREKLILTPTRSDDGTVITCSAWNNVTVQQPKETVKIDLTYSPKANLTGLPNTVIEGTPGVNLKCTASSKPAATFTWYKNGTELGSGTGTQADNSRSYNIDEVSRSHSGQYRCKASNGIPPVDDKSKKLIVQYPPDVTATGHDGTVIDQSVTITCSPNGVPDTYTYYSWVHSWSDGHVISHQPELPAAQTLTLTGLTYQHAGVYTCMVTNGVAPYGTSDIIRQGSTSFITVKSHPVINNPDLGVNKVHKLSTKLHHETSINITYYSNVDGTNVSCHQVVNDVTQSASVGVVTTETAVIQLPVFGSTVPASGTRAEVKLTIDNASELGLYQVKLTNPIGTTTVDLQIQSEGPPEPPEHPSVSGVSTTSVNVSWNLGFHGGFSQHIVVQYSTDGVAWTDGAILDTALNESPNRHHVSVDSLSPGQLYSMRMYAYNEKGQSDYTDTFNVTTSTCTPVTDGESAACTDVVPIVGGLVAALVVIIIVEVACVLVHYKKGYRITGPGNKRDKYSAHVYENDFGTERRKSPNVARRVPATPASQDKGPAGTTSAGTGPGPVYDEVDGDHQVGAGSRDESPSITDSAGTGPGPVYEQVDGDPQVGAGSRDESITATYEMLERRQSENRTYDELRLPAPPEYENTRIP